MKANFLWILIFSGISLSAMDNTKQNPLIYLSFETNDIVAYKQPVLEQSKTLKNLIEDMELMESSKENPLPMPEPITYQAWHQYIDPYLEKCFVLRNTFDENSKQQKKNELQALLECKSNEVLGKITYNATCFEIEILHQAALQAMYNKLQQDALITAFKTASKPETFNPFNLNHDSRAQLITLFKEKNACKHGRNPIASLCSSDCNPIWNSKKLEHCTLPQALLLHYIFKNKIPCLYCHPNLYAVFTKISKFADVQIYPPCRCVFHVIKGLQPKASLH